MHNVGLLKARTSYYGGVLRRIKFVKLKDAYRTGY